MRIKLLSLYIIICFLCLFGCRKVSSSHNHNEKYSTCDSDKRERTMKRMSTRSETETKKKTRGHAIVQMEQTGGVYLVPITVNGLNLRFILDTGASNISLSSAEALVMMRQGKLLKNDIVGQQQFHDATGGVLTGTIVILRTVKIGEITLENVEASVVDNIQAPLLLGQTALSKFGRVTIDYNNNTIEFY